MKAKIAVKTKKLTPLHNFLLKITYRQFYSFYPWTVLNQNNTAKVLCIKSTPLHCATQFSIIHKLINPCIIPRSKSLLEITQKRVNIVTPLLANLTPPGCFLSFVLCLTLSYIRSCLLILQCFDITHFVKCIVKFLISKAANVNSAAKLDCLHVYEYLPCSPDKSIRYQTLMKYLRGLPSGSNLASYWSYQYSDGKLNV